MIDGAITASKLLYNFPRSWNDCVVLGRVKFEKYFNHKARRAIRNLLCMRVLTVK
jgi:ubiquitin-activating enzyme E1-like protein 2